MEKITLFIAFTIFERMIMMCRRPELREGGSDRARVEASLSFHRSASGRFLKLPCSFEILKRPRFHRLRMC